MNKNKKLRNFYISMVVLFAVVVTISTAVLTFAIINRCEKYMLSNTSALVSADATQLTLNINSHLDGIEGNVALMFADDEFTEYDSANSGLDEYDKIKIESSIASRIVDLGALENYSDFCVVYSNDNTVGWKSKTTQSLYSKGGIYDDMCSYISDENKQSGWKFGVKDNFDRMYYVKRYNQNAVIIASFYTRELERTFEYPEELRGMTVRLVDDIGNTVYSSNTEEIGSKIPEDQIEYINNENELSVITESSIINTGRCKNGWTVMCIVSRDDMMKEFNSLRNFAFTVSAIVLVIVLSIIVTLLRRLSKPMDGYVEDLSEKATIDDLSGTLNRRAYEEIATKQLAEHKDKNYAFIMLDIDFFKSINDTLGHDCGDEIISRMGKLLSNHFIESEEIKPIIGRIGGDEFTVFISLNNENSENSVTDLMQKLLESFLTEFAKERETIPLSLSGGVAFYNEELSSYQKLYMAADSALYKSKENGKNQFTVYKGEDSNE
ncbi:MAG: GGDEF domain-containing protein [Lachnospiraceae bacterium]|nr:GGDEF domain-containing protein [Lachnospiraceae bacterium]MDO4967050.1 GGDEF domain-containing protein [Lachnospiraceae bacterium]